MILSVLVLGAVAVIVLNLPPTAFGFVFAAVLGYVGTALALKVLDKGE